MSSNNEYVNQRGMIGTLRKNASLRSANLHSQMDSQSVPVTNHNLVAGPLRAKTFTRQ